MRAIWTLLFAVLAGTAVAQPTISPEHVDALTLCTEGLDMISRMKVDALGKELSVTVRWTEHRDGSHLCYQAWTKPDKAHNLQLAALSDPDLDANVLALHTFTMGDKFFSLPKESLEGIPFTRNLGHSIYRTRLFKALTPIFARLSDKNASPRLDDLPYPSRLASSLRNVPGVAEPALDVFLGFQVKTAWRYFRFQHIDGKLIECGEIDTWPKEYMSKPHSKYLEAGRKGASTDG